jgi:hypothetical protein
LVCGLDLAHPLVYHQVLFCHVDSGCLYHSFYFVFGLRYRCSFSVCFLGYQQVHKAKTTAQLVPQTQKTDLKGATVTMAKNKIE